MSQPIDLAHIKAALARSTQGTREVHREDMDSGEVTYQVQLEDAPFTVLAFFDDSTNRRAKYDAELAAMGPEWLKALVQEVEVLRTGLEDALLGWQDAAQYKGEYLAEKHGDAEDIEVLRGLLREAS